MSEQKLELLIVEDNVAEAIYAQLEAIKLGLKGVMAVTDLQSALRKMEERPQMIVSDLFFPGVGVDRTGYIPRLLPQYEKMEKRDGEISEAEKQQHDPVKAAVEQCANLFGMTPEEYVEEVIAKYDPIDMVVKAARNSVYNMRDHERYQKAHDAKLKMLSGENFPSGIFVVERAKELEIPVRIVTSTNHHDIAFETIRELVTGRYYDTLDADGRKQWSAAIKDLLEGRY
jgi:hypothetical protein